MERWYIGFFLCTLLCAHTPSTEQASLQKELSLLEHKLAQLQIESLQAHAEIHSNPSRVEKIAHYQRLDVYIKTVKELINEKKRQVTLYAIGQPPTNNPQKTSPNPPQVSAPKQTEAQSTQRKQKISPPKKTIKLPRALKKVPEKTQKPCTRKKGLYSHMLVRGSVIKPYGKEGPHLPDPMHQKGGVVYNCAPDTVVYAPVAAEVILVEKIYGRMACILKHNENFYTAIYGIEYILTSEGDTVQSGQPIGRLQCTKPALLYTELRKNSDIQDISQHLV